MLQLYLASVNQGKAREFQSAGLPHNIAVETVPRITELPACREDGSTFEENACRKALHYSRYVADPVFADDSGICVEALGGAPGIYSARFAGPRATDADNNSKLLAELRRVADQAGARAKSEQTLAAGNAWAAYYDCVIALARQGIILALVEGRVEGQIVETPRGSGGFGYDPYFFYPPLGRTLAELAPEEKFAVSHRGEAFRRLIAFIEENPDVL